METLVQVNVGSTKNPRKNKRGDLDPEVCLLIGYTGVMQEEGQYHGIEIEGHHSEIEGQEVGQLQEHMQKEEGQEVDQSLGTEGVGQEACPGQEEDQEVDQGQGEGQEVGHGQEEVLDQEGQF